MLEIPRQLQQDTFRFIKLKDKSKEPLERWKNTDNHYKHNDSELLNYNGNYGILTGNGLIVIDFDVIDVSGNVIAENLPDTFVVKTAKGQHYYYKSDLESKIILKDKEGKHIGEIQSNGQYVVAPNSTHPSGMRYKVVKDVDIAVVELGELLGALNPVIETDNDNLTHITNNYNNTHSERNSVRNSERNSEWEEGESINIFEDKRFEEDYYLKRGLSFIEFDDLSKAIQECRWDFQRNKINVVVTKGSVHRSPNDFKADDIDIVLTFGAVKAIRKLNKSLKHAFFIFYRASERVYSCVEVQKNDYFELLNYSKEDIISFFTEFRKASQTKLFNLKKNNGFKSIIRDLVNGIEDNSLTDEMLIPLTFEAVKMGISDKQIHNIYKLYFKERYDYNETQRQIEYSKRGARK